MNPDDFEAGHEAADLLDNKRLRLPMTLSVARVCNNDPTGFSQECAEETCEVCREDLEVGEVAIRVADGCGIQCFWHRRCLESSIVAGPIDEDILNARFDEVADSWASRGR